MSALEYLWGLGFDVEADGTRLAVSPEDALTDELCAYIRTHKAAILAELQTSAISLDCEAAPGTTTGARLTQAETAPTGDALHAGPRLPANGDDARNVGQVGNDGRPDFACIYHHVDIRQRPDGGWVCNVCHPGPRMATTARTDTGNQTKTDTIQTKGQNDVGFKIVKKVYKVMAAGRYPAVVKALTLTDGDYGQQVRWEFAFDDGSTLHAWASFNLSEKSKLGGWTRALLGTLPDEFDSDRLVGKACMLVLSVVEKSEGRFNRVDDVQPGEAETTPAIVAIEAEAEIEAIPF